MKVLFVTMAWPNLNEKNLYSDLMEEFSADGNEISVLSMSEKRNCKKTCLCVQNGMHVLRVRIGNTQKNKNKYRKAINAFWAGVKMYIAAKRFLKKQRFDLILFSTPPITVTPFIIMLKKAYKSTLYLLLKDIWPQDSVDLGVMKKGGLAWKIFRYLEVLTYKHADYIGCMSPANVDFVLKNNPYLNKDLVEICPNSMKDFCDESVDKSMVRAEYGIPADKMVLLFGGNLGKAQGVNFLIDIAQAYRHNSDVFFMIVGDGTEYSFLFEEIERIATDNMKIIPSIKRDAYEKLVRACDVGLIFLKPGSLVPNFPSRLLSYLIAQKPVIAAIDKSSDLGTILQEHHCGIQCENGDIDAFCNAVTKLMDEDLRKTMGQNAKKLFLAQYTSRKSYEIIMKHFKNGAQANETEN